MNTEEIELSKSFDDFLDKLFGDDIDEFFGEEQIKELKIRNLQIKLEKLNKENYEMD